MIVELIILALIGVLIMLCLYNLLYRGDSELDEAIRQDNEQYLTRAWMYFEDEEKEEPREQEPKRCYPEPQPEPQREPVRKERKTIRITDHTRQAEEEKPEKPLPPIIFKVRNLSVDYYTPESIIHVLRNVNINLYKEMTAILGTSGQGKTTFLRTLGGLLAPTEGKVAFKDELIPYDSDADLRHFRATCVDWVFQNLNLFGHQTALENVMFPMLCRRISRAEAKERALWALKLTGIEDLWDRSLPQMSQGQKQRVAIAQAFASNCDVILADEPTASLDPDTAELVMSELRRLSLALHKPVVLVTHNPTLAKQYCDRILKCQKGTLVEIWRRPDEEEEEEEDKTIHQKAAVPATY